MTTIKVFMLCTTVSLFTGIASYVMATRNNQKIAVVNAVRLFENYNLKKELELAAKKDLEAFGRNLDSISSQVKMARATANSQAEQQMTNLYEQTRTKLDDRYAKSNREINEQVWRRLNAAIEEFGKTKKLHLIIGANGMGSVLYNDAYYDLTEEAIAYANNKYEQGN